MSRFDWIRSSAQDIEDEEEKQAQLFALKVLRFVGLFMVAVVALYGGGSYLMGSSLFVPGSAEGVIKSVATSKNYAWTSEAVRLVKFPGQTTETEQDSLRSAVLNLKTNQFQTLSSGVVSDRTVVVSDGHFTTFTRDQDQTWQLVTNVCKNAPAMDAKIVAMPGPAQLLKLSPRIIDDQASVLNQRAWQLEFKPDKAFLKQLFWLDFYDKALPADDKRWTLSAKERGLLDTGKYKIEYATALITREKPRTLFQYEVKLQFEGGSKYRFLAKYNPQTQPLELNFGDPGCNGKGIDLATPSFDQALPDSNSQTPATTPTTPAQTTPTATPAPGGTGIVIGK